MRERIIINLAILKKLKNMEPDNLHTTAKITNKSQFKIQRVKKNLEKIK